MADSQGQSYGDSEAQMAGRGEDVGEQAQRVVDQNDQKQSQGHY